MLFQLSDLKSESGIRLFGFRAVFAGPRLKLLTLVERLGTIRQRYLPPSRFIVGLDDTEAIR